MYVIPALIISLFTNPHSRQSIHDFLLLSLISAVSVFSMSLPQALQITFSSESHKYIWLSRLKAAMLPRVDSI